jgi:hypothetical protein
VEGNIKEKRKEKEKENMPLLLPANFVTAVGILFCLRSVPLLFAAIYVTALPSPFGW